MAFASDPSTQGAAVNDPITGIVDGNTTQASTDLPNAVVQPSEGQLAAGEKKANKQRNQKNRKKIIAPKTAEEAAKQVFAGNLAFNVSEADLKTLFSEVGTVVEMQVVSRGNRSLGYCFVQYETPEEAQKAISTLSKRVVQGRELNIEPAKPQDEINAAREAKKQEKAAAAKEAGEEVTEKKPKAKKAKKPKAGARRPRADDGEEGTAAEGAEVHAVTEEEAAANGVNGEPATATKTKKKNARKNKAKKAVANGEADPLAPAAEKAAATDAVDGAAAEGATSPTTAKKAKPARQPRVRKGPPAGEPSKTLIFIANLAFTIADDEALKAVFEGLQVKSATVVKRKYGTKRSKGFGFVDFASEEDQQKALSQYQGKEVGGRALSLKVAIEGSKEDAEKENDESQTAAVASEAPAEVTA